MGPGNYKPWICGLRQENCGSSGSCMLPCLLGALPPDPRHLTLWANSMKKKCSTTGAPNRRRGCSSRAAAEDRSEPQTRRAGFGNPLCRQAPRALQPFSGMGDASFAAASPYPHHAAGGKRKMPGVREQRPRSLAAIYAKVRKNRMKQILLSQSRANAHFAGFHKEPRHGGG